MITKITGTLSTVSDDRVRMQVGPLEYELWVSDTVRKQLQSRTGQEITLHTSHYLDAGAMQSKITPRLIGFMMEAELEFFDLFCTVDKVGVKKALKAFTRPIREIADAIQRQDVKSLSSLPGIGGATAEKIVATLRKKVAKFALMRDTGEPVDLPPMASTKEMVLQDAYSALISIGHTAPEARQMIDRFTAKGVKFETVEDVFNGIYQQGA
jgi:holliday junction DNA helicase RuvA